MYSFGLSLTNYRLGKNPKYIGFENYAEIPGRWRREGRQESGQHSQLQRFSVYGQHGGDAVLWHLRRLGL